MTVCWAIAARGLPGAFYVGFYIYSRFQCSAGSRARIIITIIFRSVYNNIISPCGGHYRRLNETPRLCYHVILQPPPSTEKEKKENHGPRKRESEREARDWVQVQRIIINPVQRTLAAAPGHRNRTE
jgi:hypothetical protein